MIVVNPPPLMVVVVCGCDSNDGYLSNLTLMIWFALLLVGWSGVAWRGVVRVPDVTTT